MKELLVHHESGSYRVYIDNNMDRFKVAMEQNKIGSENKMFLITDSRLNELYKVQIAYFIKQYKCCVFSFKEGEESKSINTLQNIYDFLIENDADRESVLIAFGGGVVGDLAGFAASTFMRGIKYINIPTSLISQVDSCIGGKTGYNHKDIKNIIGSFYNPVFVYVNTAFLKTLDNALFVDGFGEVIKHGIIKDKALLDFVNQNFKQIMEFESDKLIHIVKECLRIKSELIEADFKDYGIRNVLNFGHTIGHSIEIISNYTITHGSAVALGMLVALRISETKLGLSKNVYNYIASIYNKLGLPTKYKVDNYPLFMYAINHDKKNHKGTRFVLLEDIAKCKVKVEVSENEIIEAVKTSISF